MDRWQRSSSRVTEIDFGWWRCNQALSLRTGGSQYRDDQFPRKTGEIDSARSHMNVSAIFPFTSAIIRRASALPSPTDPSRSSVLCSLLSIRSCPLVHRITRRCIGLEKVSPLSFALSTSLSPRSRASDGKWFSFFLLFDDLFLPC